MIMLLLLARWPSDWQSPRSAARSIDPAGRRIAVSHRPWSAASLAAAPTAGATASLARVLRLVRSASASSSQPDRY